jgi:mono/diheme cytochrome c family protein
MRRPPFALAIAWLGSLVLVGCGGGQVERGAALYEINCGSCHGGASGGTVRDIPPPHNASGHTWHHQDCLLTKIILDGFEDPDAPEDKPKMPAFKGQLTDEEVAAILTHIKTWWTEEQRQWQRQVTQQSCS